MSLTAATANKSKFYFLKMKKSLAILSFLMCLPFSASAAVWVASGNGDSKLYEIDIATGATIRTVGDTGQYFTGLAYNVSTRKLIGTTSPNSATPGSVFEIDPQTAVATLIGAHGVDQAIIDLSFSPSGVLFGWVEPGQDRLVTIDLTTGAATPVGPTVNSAGRTIEFTNSGNIALFNLSSATLFDPTTGIPTGTVTLLDGDGDINASFRISTGLAYAIKQVGNSGGTRTLVTVDFDTGVTTELGPITVLNASAIASDFLDPTLNPSDPGYVPPSTHAAIPTLSEWGMIFMAGLMAVFGIRRIRRN